MKKNKQEDCSCGHAKQTDATRKFGTSVQPSDVLTGFVAEDRCTPGHREASDLVPLILIFIHTVKKVLWAILAWKVVSLCLDLSCGLFQFASTSVGLKRSGSGAELLLFQRVAGGRVEESDNRDHENQTLQSFLVGILEELWSTMHLYGGSRNIQTSPIEWKKRNYPLSAVFFLITYWKKCLRT